MNSNGGKAPTSAHFTRRRNHPRFIRCLPERIYCHGSGIVHEEISSRHSGFRLVDTRRRILTLRQCVCTDIKLSCREPRARDRALRSRKAISVRLSEFLGAQTLFKRRR